jgi:hypothetical protein
MRVCETPDCGATIPPQQGSARPRKFCVTCRPPRNRKNPRIITLPDPMKPTVVPIIESSAEHQPSDGLERVYQEQLRAADRLNTPDGAHVMLLASLFANGQHTAAGAAALSRELRAAMEVALRGANRHADALDELSARRTRKATGA